MKIYVYAKTSARMLIEALTLIAKYWKQPTYPSVSEEFYKFGISKQCNTAQQIKRMNTCNLDGPQGHTQFKTKKKLKMLHTS